MRPSRSFLSFLGAVISCLFWAGSFFIIADFFCLFLQNRIGGLASWAISPFFYFTKVLFIFFGVVVGVKNPLPARFVYSSRKRPGKKKKIKSGHVFRKQGVIKSETQEESAPVQSDKTEEYLESLAVFKLDHSFVRQELESQYQILSGRYDKVKVAHLPKEIRLFARAERSAIDQAYRILVREKFE